MREDYTPVSPQARLRVLDQILAHGDRAAFLRAARPWLLQQVREQSAGS